jgi:tetratricopeptide (TPR) repeat protein
MDCSKNGRIRASRAGALGLCRLYFGTATTTIGHESKAAECGADQRLRESSSADGLAKPLVCAAFPRFGSAQWRQWSLQSTPPEPIFRGFSSGRLLQLGMAEKSVTELPKELRQLHTKANDALQRENFDYAMTLFNQILLKEPAMHECRRGLRNAQLRKADGNRSMFKKLWSSASSQPLVAKGQLALRTHPVDAFPIAEQILDSDPYNSGAHKLVVEAANALEMPQTALMSLEILNRNAPKDVEIAIKYAYALGALGQAGKAEKLLSDLASQNPTNSDLAQAVKDLSARKTLDEQGYEKLADGSGSYRDILRDKEEAVSLEQEKRQVQTEDTAARLIREKEARLKTEPGNLKLLRDLAELYTQKKQFDRALSYYEQMKLAGATGDASLDRAIGETTVRKLDYQISQLDPNELEFAEKSARLQAEKQAFQLAECQKRSERFPTDMQIRYELGLLLVQAGKINEAIKEFQKAQNNPQRRISAMCQLAQCFARKGINDLAASTLQDALKEKQVFDDEKKELIYVLGTVLEKMGKRDEAITQYKIIYAVDSEYRDVQAKIDAFYGGSA